MEQPNASQPALPATRLTKINPDTGEREELHIESLTMPSLLSIPLTLAWLRKPFQRKPFRRGPKT